MHVEMTWVERTGCMGEGWECASTCPACGGRWVLFPEDVQGQAQALEHARMMFDLLVVCSDCRAGAQSDAPEGGPPLNRAARRAAQRRRPR